MPTVLLLFSCPLRELNGKVQVNIPKEIRSKLHRERRKMILKPTPRIEAGEPVGEEEYKKIITELDERRKNWR
jgi:hypothetical protein